MEETEYLREGTMLVTSTRIEINGQTFAVRNVGSVKVTKGGLPWFAALIGIGAIGMLASKDARVGGAILLLAVGAWIWQKVKRRTLVLVTGGGETVALQTNDGALVERVRGAVAAAISGR